MYESEYVRKMHEDAAKLVEQDEKRKRLEKIYNQNSGKLDVIETNYRLSEDEKAMLKDIDSTEKHQQELDEVFLKAFKEN